MKQIFRKIQQTIVTFTSMYKRDEPPIPPIKKFWVDGDNNKIVDGNGNHLVFRVTEP